MCVEQAVLVLGTRSVTSHECAGKCVSNWGGGQSFDEVCVCRIRGVFNQGCVEICVSSNVFFFETAFIFNVFIEQNVGKDYFNERDEATDCEEPRSKTVNLFRFSLSSSSSVQLPSPASSILININTMFIISLS